ncbi:MAG TPA: hypothetical protein P5060_00810 [Candidatus Absconditabacterales bacterium]|nr:hypothetical protein [Candidatus Absconditabacterales bacterium]
MSESYPRFGVYKIQKGQQIQQSILHESFSNIIEKSVEDQPDQQTFLLDESRFSFFRFDIFLDSKENFSIQDLHEVTEEKMEFIENEKQIKGKFLTTYIDSIFVDGEEKSFVIGESGDIFFRLYIIYIDTISLNKLNSTYGKIRENKSIKILPQSFHTVLFLRNNLKRDNFLLLYITESFAKVIKIKDSFYDSVHVINLGLNSLKQMYKDNGISQCRYKDNEKIQENMLADNLVRETLEFYSNLFFSRLEEQGCIGNDIFVISPVVKNGCFMEIFNKKYREYTNNYIVPFHHSDKLKNFDSQREPDGMDTLIYLNREQSDLFD